MLEKLKLLLGISDASQDSLLGLILDNTSSRLKLLLGGIEAPEEMAHIILEVAVIRFNRIGSEGMASHTVEGESLSFSSDDFAAYADEIQAFLNAQESAKRGRVRFL